MREGKQIVTGDLFSIADRLKAIDDGYFVVLDKHTGTYEIHNRFQRGNTFALKVPYPSLDARTVELVRKTRVENAARILAEAERENAKLARRRDKAMMENALKNYG